MDTDGIAALSSSERVLRRVERGVLDYNLGILSRALQISNFEEANETTVTDLLDTSNCILVVRPHSAVQCRQVYKSMMSAWEFINALRITRTFFYHKAKKGILCLNVLLVVISSHYISSYLNMLHAGEYTSFLLVSDICL